MAEEQQDCTRCKAVGTIECDPIDGFLICTACGFVADESSAWLHNQSAEMDENQAFANVDSEGRVKGEKLSTWIQMLTQLGPRSNLIPASLTHRSGERQSGRGLQQRCGEGSF